MEKKIKRLPFFSVIVWGVHGPKLSPECMVWLFDQRLRFPGDEKQILRTIEEIHGFKMYSQLDKAKDYILDGDANLLLYKLHKYNDNRYFEKAHEVLKKQSLQGFERIYKESNLAGMDIVDYTQDLMILNEIRNRNLDSLFKMISIYANTPEPQLKTLINEIFLHFQGYINTENREHAHRKKRDRAIINFYRWLKNNSPTQDGKKVFPKKRDILKLLTSWFPLKKQYIEQILKGNIKM